MKKTAVFLLMLALFSACRKDPAVVDVAGSGYPVEVGNIVLSRCATDGCHNTLTRSAGLDLSTWKSLFEGASNGAAVIPFASQQSSMFQFCNTFPTLGITAIPTMPVNGNTLDQKEVLLLKSWIDKGAPDSKGNIAFAENPGRSKYYVCNQGCDLITVFDAESGLPMRSISCGVSASIESPHQIKVSPDGKYYYVIFTGGSALQKFSASDDKPIGTAELGFSNWNTLSISPDGSLAVCVDWSSFGQVVVVNLNTMQVAIRYPQNLFVFPHGSCISPDNQYLLVTSQIGNYIYRIPIAAPHSLTNPNLDDITFSLNGNAPENIHGLDPHEIIYSADGSLFFVSCQGSNEIRVFHASTFAPAGVIHTPMFPQEMSITKDGNTLVFSCPEDTLSTQGKRGSVSLVHIPTLSVTKTLYTGHQPHGIAIDERKKWVVVANRNFSSGGPAPHHVSVCGGKNGNVTFIDLQTQQMVEGKKTEVSVDPYFVSVRP